MVIRDRLQEIAKVQHSSSSPAPAPIATSSSSSSSYFPVELNVNGLYNNSNNGNGNQGNDDPFLEQCAQMRHSLEQIHGRIRQMVQVQETILGQPIVQPGDKAQLDTLIEQIRERASWVRQMVHRLEEAMAMERRREEEEQRQHGRGGGGGIGQAARRIRQNQMDQLRRLLNEVLNTFYSAQEDYRQRVTRRVKRQLELAGEQLAPGEVEQLLEQQSEQIFYRQHHHGPMMSSAAAQLALADASSRHSELLRLEQGIAELGECFRDMHTLVHSQGELVDRIETNINAASEYTGQARVQIYRAVTYKKSSQRFKCAIVLLLSGVLLLLFLVLAIFLGRFMPNIGTH